MKMLKIILLISQRLDARMQTQVKKKVIKQN